MEFKAGDRVHVLRLNGEDVDFYGTLKYVDKCMANLFGCTIKRNEGLAVFLPSDNSFGEDKEDYYILAEDEEDTIGGNNMPTIKRKVEMNLPQLIEWIIENDTTYEQYEPMLVKGLRFVAVDGYGDIRIHGFVRPDDIFTIEIEKEITEDTVFDKLISRYVFLSSKPSYAHAINVSIKEVIEDRKKATHIYFENEDNELQLIWKNGKLVE